jgi:hypothetical protein
MAPLLEGEQHAEPDNATPASSSSSSSSASRMTTVLKLVAASAFLYGAVSTYQQGQLQQQRSHNDGFQDAASVPKHGRRRLLSAIGDSIPKYMDPLLKDLRERKKLFDETPPEEVKYWFEYTGPLQVCILFGRGRNTYLLLFWIFAGLLWQEATGHA